MMSLEIEKYNGFTDIEAPAVDLDHLMDTYATTTGHEARPGDRKFSRFLLAHANGYDGLDAEILRTMAEYNDRLATPQERFAA